MPTRTRKHDVGIPRRPSEDRAPIAAASCVITLKHPGTDDHVLSFARDASADGAWVERVLLVPLQPHRLIGFVHPEADELVGTTPFVLHAAFTFMSSVALKPLETGSMQVVAGPRVVLPYEMISGCHLVPVASRRARSEASGKKAQAS